VEPTDIFKLLKFWRIIKTFKSGGLRVKAKGIAGVFALGFSAVSYFLYGDITAEALDLTPQDRPVLEACLSNHKQLGMSFQGRISNAAGCGCTAKLVTSTIAAEHLDSWAQAHALMLHNYQEEWSVSSEVQQKAFEANKKQMFSALQKKSNIPATQFSAMVDDIHKFDDICEDEATYEEASIGQLAALRPIGFEAQLAEAQLTRGENTQIVEIQLRGARAPIKTASK